MRCMLRAREPRCFPILGFYSSCVYNRVDETRQDLWSTYYVLGTVLSILHVLIWPYYVSSSCYHFTDEEAEAERPQITFPKFGTWRGWDQGPLQAHWLQKPDSSSPLVCCVRRLTGGFQDPHPHPNSVARVDLSEFKTCCTNHVQVCCLLVSSFDL